MSNFSGGLLLRNPREGFRSEYLAFYAFSAFGPAVQYRSENDFGFDFICNICDVDGHYLNVKGTYGVQVKSENYEFKYKGKQFFDWYFHLEFPFLLCTVSKSNTRIKVYSAWNLMRLYFQNSPNESWNWPEEIHFVLDETMSLLQEPDLKTGIVPLGKPILEFDILDLGTKENLDNYRKIVDEWVEMDRRNHMNKRSTLWFTSGFVRWETNQSLDHGPRTFYTNYYYSPFSYDQAKVGLFHNLSIMALYLKNKKSVSSNHEEIEKCDKELEYIRKYLSEFGSAHADMFCRRIIEEQKPLQ